MLLCKTSAFRYKPRRTLVVFQRFNKHCSCHLQGEYMLVVRLWKVYIGQEVGRHIDPENAN
jgi:hypothetical protein